MGRTAYSTMKDIYGYSKRLDQALDRVANSSVVGD
jgi:hypothetical protein